MVIYVAPGSVIMREVMGVRVASVNTAILVRIMGVRR